VKATVVMELGRGQAGEYEPIFLVVGGLLIGAGLFLGGYASLSNPVASILTVAFLLSGILLSEAMFAGKPILYVVSSAILAITIGCCILMLELWALLAGAFCILGPVAVAKGLKRPPSS